MPQLPAGFDPNKEQPLQDFRPLETGKYTAQIVASTLKESASGNGTFFEFEFEVLDKEYLGRKVWERVHVDNPNPKAVAFGRSILTSISIATGVMRPQSTEEFHNRPMTISVVKEQRTDDPSKYRNSIKQYVKREMTSVAKEPAPADNGTHMPDDSTDDGSVPW